MIIHKGKIGSYLQRMYITTSQNRKKSKVIQSGGKVILNILKKS